MFQTSCPEALDKSLYISGLLSRGVLADVPISSTFSAQCLALLTGSRHSRMKLTKNVGMDTIPVPSFGKQTFRSQSSMFGFQMNLSQPPEYSDTLANNQVCSRDYLLSFADLRQLMS